MQFEMKIKVQTLILLILLCWNISISTNILNAQTTTINYTADTISLFPNPERGWVHSYNPSGNTPAPDLVLSTLQYWRSGSDHVTLARKYYLLKAYLNGPVDQSFLDKFQKDLNTCRAAGVKLIPRFIYIWDPATVNQDAPLQIVIQHIEQLKPYFQANWDVIAFIETGFIGQYGEWHDSDWSYIKNNTLEIKPDGFTVRDSLLSALPAQRFIAMRMMYWHKFKIWINPLTEITAFGNTTQARIGYHNDGVMSTPVWDAEGCGECPPYSVMHNYMLEDTRWVPNTGEPCGENYFDTHDPQPELKAVHQSTLVNNACIDYSKWKSPKTWYQGLTRDMGYRFTAKKATYSSIVPGENLTLSLALTNSGYAAPFNERMFEIILRNQITGEKYVTDVTSTVGHSTDPRYWLPGNHTISITVPVPADLASGDYDIIVNLPDPAPLLHDRPEYSIRLANQNMWEATTGYNVLNRLISTGIETVKSIKLNLDIYPNPAYQSASLSYQLSENSNVIISVTDLLGKEILKVSNEKQSAGDHVLNINLAQLRAGIYLVKMNVNGEPVIHKLVINK